MPRISVFFWSGFCQEEGNRQMKSTTFAFETVEFSGGDVTAVVEVLFGLVGEGAGAHINTVFAHTLCQFVDGRIDFHHLIHFDW